MSFDRNSNFNKDANFQSVKFGENKPVLEVELNELQEIQNEARADIIRDSIPSGFVQLGELDYDYMLNNENCVKMKTESIAYVNGYRITIPKDTIINIGKAPEKDAREDLLFLEVWKEEVNKDTILTKNGGEGQAEITNNIKDSRYPVETTRRVALKWRIRHVADVDFEKHPRGLSEKQYGGTAKDKIKISQNLLKFELGTNTDRDYISQYSCSNDTTHDSIGRYGNDVGLFVAGNGNTYLVNTTDGWVYAIPMFRLYRKPSCGKAIPFEYQKINPKVNYSKFTDLMKEEKVERVVNETIGGRSLVNLCTNGENLSSSISYIDTRFLTQIKADTKYTIIFTLSEVVPGQYNLPINLSIENSATSGLVTVPFTNGTHKCIINTRNMDSTYPLDVSKPVYLFIWTQSNNVGQSFRTSNIIVLEGDWTEKEIPEYFTGLKSLGEDEGNLITVKNAILNESSYDPDTGTPKLNTVSGANYITSDNLIMPTIEAQVKRGETKLSDLTSFDKIDNMTGDEVVDFTKIKGRTLQNLITNKTWTVNSSGANAYMSMNWELLKPNTNYTYFVINPSPKMNLTKGYVGNRFVTYSSLDISKPVLLTTIPDFSVVTGTSYPHVYPIDDSLLTQDDLANVKLLLLEGDWTNVPLDQIPYVEGIKSVGENEDNKVVVKRTGKNLINLKNININPNYKLSLDIEKGSITCNDNSTYNDIQFYVKLYKGKTYKISMKGLTLGSDNFNILKGKQKGYVPTEIANVTITKYEGQFTFNDNTGYYTLHVPNIRNTVSDIILVEGTETNGFEPYKEYKQEITLKEPLRSLPNGVCDEIVGNKVIRRIGKVVLDGSENWKVGGIGDEIINNFRADIILTSLNLKKGDSFMYCNRFSYNYIHRFSAGSSEKDIECVTNHSTERNHMIIIISRDKLPTKDLSGFKTWLSQNPTTVYYELETPIEEVIEPNYDKESIKTYQLDQPLRSLPNGVKDEIVDGKLIRRCGEVILDGTETWSIATNGVTSETHKVFTSSVLRGYKLDGASNLLFCDKFISTSKSFKDMTNEGLEAISNNTSLGLIYISIATTKLSSQDSTGFKNWLKENPLKVVYELATPIEIPLKEVLPSKVNFSLERQFKYSDNYLLELPNGVKDTVENNKVTRRVKKVVLNGSESWADSSSLVLTNTLAFRVIPSDKKVDTEIFCDKFKYVYHNSLTTLDEEFITGQGTTSQVYVRIAKSKLSSPDLVGFKAWLSDNPITIMYELTTPTTEELSGNNNMYCPSHEINTYCGSMYIGDGTNDVLVENGLKNDGIVIDTPFRSIADKEVVTDCKYKKSVDGYDNMYIRGRKNLFDIVRFYDRYGTMSYDESTNSYSHVSTELHSACRFEFLINLNSMRFYPGRKYMFSAKVSTESYKGYMDVSFSNSNFTKLDIIINENSKDVLINGEFEVSKNYSYDPKEQLFFRVYFKSKPIGSVAKLKDIMICEEDSINNTEFEPFIPMEKAFENTESNDIEDLRHQVSLTGFNYEELLNKSFDSLLRGEL